MKKNKETKADEVLKVKTSITEHPMFKMLVIEGTKYRTLTSRKNELRTKWEAPKVKELKSFIPGTIIKVAVKSGDKVEPGDLLMIFEAMKMQNKVLCPFPGVIKAINVKEGERIPKGFVIAEYE
ncbi:MAG: acetyl-CoA carboxylase biotin carboxyl carrier protein subunit [Bacteroidales bacterium]|jgi:pyruvate carboxylase|nr:acetyl-CoA carboxylase biotin carboxyl carrier protein subunit [Bacteroidales bacterium]MDD4385085.1 acetyl-CoA carboxylase biotin carboxyl carrier protein subunit [Bacteroidales bacterium]MDY0196396.1 acetyl-CoA carboxylase biotin carboxyl carrier protein subunit [Tenuifilaceae bacterium]